MLVTPHAVVGATVGARLRVRFIAAGVALTSHFLLDMVPHWQETLPPYNPQRRTWVRVPIDLTLALVLTRWIARRSDRPDRVWWSALAGVAPDLDFVWFLAPAKLSGIKPLLSYYSWHCRIQRETPRWSGILPQLGVIALCGVALRARRSMSL